MNQSIPSSPTDATPLKRAMNVLLMGALFASVGGSIWAYSQKDKLIGDIQTELKGEASAEATKTCQGYLGKSEIDLTGLVTGSFERSTESDGSVRLTWTRREAARTSHAGMYSHHIPASAATTQAILRDGKCVSASLEMRNDEGDRSVVWSGRADSEAIGGVR